MRKLAFFTLSLAFIYTFTVFADEIGGRKKPEREKDPVTKLESLDKVIKKYEDLIISLPAELEASREELVRLKGIGNAVKETVSKHLGAMSSCANKEHSSTGKEACETYLGLDLGDKLLYEKNKINEAIAAAERIRDEVQANNSDLPLIKDLLESLRSTRTLLSYE